MEAKQPSRKRQKGRIYEAGTIVKRPADLVIKDEGLRRKMLAWYKPDGENTGFTDWKNLWLTGTVCEVKENNLLVEWHCFPESLRSENRSQISSRRKKLKVVGEGECLIDYTAEKMRLVPG